MCRSKAKAGGPRALCKAHSTEPAITADPRILNIFCPKGCSASWSETSQIPPANNLDRPGTARCEALHTGRNISKSVLSPEQQRDSDHGQSRRGDPHGNKHYRQVPGAVSGRNSQSLGVQDDPLTGPVGDQC